MRSPTANGQRTGSERVMQFLISNHSLSHSLAPVLAVAVVVVGSYLCSFDLFLHRHSSSRDYYLYNFIINTTDWLLPSVLLLLQQRGSRYPSRMLPASFCLSPDSPEIKCAKTKQNKNMWIECISAFSSLSLLTCNSLEAAQRSKQKILHHAIDFNVNWLYFYCWLPACLPAR